MEFDANRDIVEYLINNILRGVEVPDPLLDAEVAAEIEQLNDDFVRVFFFDFSLEVLKFETYSSFFRRSI